jgi:hypothetical protein
MNNGERKKLSAAVAAGRAETMYRQSMYMELTEALRISIALGNDMMAYVYARQLGRAANLGGDPFGHGA